MIKGDAAHISNMEIPIGAVYKKAFMKKWAQREFTPHNNHS